MICLEPLGEAMRRRDFIKGMTGLAAGTWPLAARAQQMRRIGVLMSLAADDPGGQARVAALQQGLQQLGWTEDRNMHIDVRWGAGDADRVKPEHDEPLQTDDTPDLPIRNERRDDQRIDRDPRRACHERGAERPRRARERP